MSRLTRHHLLPRASLYALFAVAFREPAVAFVAFQRDFPAVVLAAGAVRSGARIEFAGAISAAVGGTTGTGCDERDRADRHILLAEATLSNHTGPNTVLR